MYNVEIVYLYKTGIWFLKTVCRKIIFAILIFYVSVYSHGTLKKRKPTDDSKWSAGINNAERECRCMKPICTFLWFLENIVTNIRAGPCVVYLQLLNSAFLVRHAEEELHGCERW